MGQIWHQVSSLDFNIFSLYFVLDFTLKMILAKSPEGMIELQTKCNTKVFFFKMVNMIARMVNMDKLDKVLWISKSTIVWCAAVLVTRNDIAKTIPANRVKTTRESRPSIDFFAIISIYQNIFIPENEFHDWKKIHLPKYFWQGDYWDLLPDGLLSISLWQVAHPKTYIR